MSINRALKELSDLNFVNFITVGKAHLWKVNKKSYAYKTLSEFIQGVSVIKEPIKNLKKIILKGLPKNLIKRVVLFGSVASGMEKVNSDIDVFILVKDKISKEKIESSIEKLSNICLDTYGNRLSPYMLTEKEIKQKKHLNLIPKIESGIQLFPEKKG